MTEREWLLFGVWVITMIVLGICIGRLGRYKEAHRGDHAMVDALMEVVHTTTASPETADVFDKHATNQQMPVEMRMAFEASANMIRNLMEEEAGAVRK